MEKTADATGMVQPVIQEMFAAVHAAGSSLLERPLNMGIRIRRRKGHKDKSRGGEGGGGEVRETLYIVGDYTTAPLPTTPTPAARSPERPMRAAANVGFFI
eukprot:scaffold8055_cov100-Isochrysis_galbana.AAC.1